MLKFRRRMKEIREKEERRREREKGRKMEARA
jgi:hypothetical protein